MSTGLHRVRFRLDHRWAPRHLSAYLDDELGSGAQRRMERHVADCAECRRLLAGLRELIRVLQGVGTRRGADAGRITASVRLRIQGTGSS